MVEQLGVHLVRKGLLSQRQLDEALKFQLIHGGSLGTALVELGLLDLGSLGQALSDTFHFPLVTEAELAAVPQETVALLRPELARRHLAFPLALEGRRLRVALVEPQDPRHVDALALATGMRIVPSILPEPRLFQLLERHYGLPRPSRALRPAGAPRPPVGQGAAPTARPPPPGTQPPGPRPVPARAPAPARPAPAAPPISWVVGACAVPPAPPPPRSVVAAPPVAATALGGASPSPGARLPPGLTPRAAPAVPSASAARSLAPPPASGAPRPEAPPSAAPARRPPPALAVVPPPAPAPVPALPVAEAAPAPAGDPFATAPPRTAELFPEVPGTPLAGAEPLDETPIITGRILRDMELSPSPVEALEMSSDMDFIASDSGSASWAQRAIEVDFASLEAADAQGVPLARVHEFLPVWEPVLEQDGEARVEPVFPICSSARGLSWVQLPEVMEALRRATTRGQLGQALLSYAEGRFPRGFLLGETFGAIRVGLACGSGSDRPEVAALKVDLSTPSLLAQAASDGGPVVSSTPESRTDEALFAALGESASHLVAAPIRVRQRAVGFVVIDGGPSPFGAEELDELERLLAAASEAYGRLHESSF